MQIFDDVVFHDMCNKANELQDSWEPKLNDIITGDLVDFIGFIGHVDDSDGSYYLRKFAEDVGMYGWYYKCELIWLPLQSQFQDIVKSECKCGIEWLHQGIKIENFSHYLNEIESIRQYKFGKINQGTFVKTWRQFWLCFVMNQLYKKDWNGFEFVSQKESKCKS